MVTWGHLDQPPHFREKKAEVLIGLVVVSWGHSELKDRVVTRTQNSWQPSQGSYSALVIWVRAGYHEGNAGVQVRTLVFKSQIFEGSWAWNLHSWCSGFLIWKMLPTMTSFLLTQWGPETKMGGCMCKGRSNGKCSEEQARVTPPLMVTLVPALPDWSCAGWGHLYDLSALSPSLLPRKSRARHEGQTQVS